MSAIVLLSLPADHDLARNIAGELSASDLDVFWQPATPGDADWAKARAEVEAARCAIFFFSAAAAAPSAEPYVGLAKRALADDKALCVRLTAGAMPDDMAGCTTYDLRGWRARASSLFMLDLVAGAKAKAAGLDPPLPRAPRQLLLKRAGIWVSAALTLVSTSIGFYQTFGVHDLLGLNRIFDPEEEAAWAAIPAGSCNGLRAYLNTHSKGEHADEARALLEARTVSTELGRRDAERVLPLYVGAASAAASPDETSAREAALARATPEAQRSCNGLAAAASARLRDASIKPGRYECESVGDGIVCAFAGEAVCRLEEPAEVTVERCATPA